MPQDEGAHIALDVTEGPRQGDRFDLPDECVVLVGRSRRCHCRVGPDMECSRVHCLMEVAAPDCRLRDLGSKNGTFVNGRRVEQADVQHGDVIAIGKTRLLVQVVGQPAGVPVAEERSLHPAQPAVPASLQEDTRPLSECLRCRAGVPLAGQAMPAADAGAVRRGFSDSEYVCPPCQQEMRERGEVLPGYRLVSQLDAGGMALLWLAEDTRTGRQVVVKTMNPELARSQRALRMFYRESSISMELRHPNIVEFLSAGQYQGQLYMVMEYVEGVDAERLRTRKGGMLAASEVVMIGGQALAALSHAHSQGIVHRDVKPSNILVQGEFPDCQVKVTDFGLARVYRAAAYSDITRRGDVRGSIPFMPPEQVMNCRAVDHRADIFALGATMYHLLTGRFCRDFNLKKKDAMLTVIEDEIVPLERRGVAVPQALAEIVNRALRREPSQRFQSAADMSAALARAGLGTS